MCFSSALCVAQDSTFQPIEQWKSAVLKGDAVALKSTLFASATADRTALVSSVVRSHAALYGDWLTSKKAMMKDSHA